MGGVPGCSLRMDTETPKVRLKVKVKFKVGLLKILCVVGAMELLSVWACIVSRGSRSEWYVVGQMRREGADDQQRFPAGLFPWVVTSRHFFISTISNLTLTYLKCSGSPLPTAPFSVYYCRPSDVAFVLL